MDNVNRVNEILLLTDGTNCVKFDANAWGVMSVLKN